MPTRTRTRDRPTPPAPAPPRSAGATTSVKDGQRAPRQPHERDESSDSQQGEPTAVMQQAHDDLERGLSDTSRGEATDVAYERNLRGHRRTAKPSRP